MQSTCMIEERIIIPGESGRLAGILAYPDATPPRLGLLLCPPHPHFAGNMENNVVRALAQRLAEDSVTLRFDYRGVGDSEIRLAADRSVFDYWNDVEEKRDYADALADVAAAARALQDAAPGLPLAVAGYSFGAAVGLLHGLGDPAVGRMAGISPPLTRIDFGFLAATAKPCLLLSGEADFVYSAERAAALQSLAGPRLRIERLAQQDHFFRGEEAILCDRVAAFLQAPLQSDSETGTANV